ncbi:ABC transporter permease [Streptomyces sp. NPDC057638]|uniref:ABC transporter permease n=1 Tax=Streptomyces sp. NPDC057638 TaxID=3346190 RepID=UPI0036C33F53
MADWRASRNRAGATTAGRAVGRPSSPALRGAGGRLAALARAEVTLLVRNRTALTTALLMPVVMVLVLKSSLAQMDLDGTGMSVGEGMVIGGIGMVLLLVVHMNLVSFYVARREELVLKRLRTGELSDPEILLGTALPSVALGLTQCVVLAVAGTAALDLSAPRRPELLVAGIVLVVVVLVALAAVTTVVTRTTESAQLTTMPVFLLSIMGSGLFVPLENLPDQLSRIAELLPMTGAMTLVRTGWLGGAGGAEVASAAVTSLVWAALSVFAVRRWFRWEPRR